MRCDDRTYWLMRAADAASRASVCDDECTYRDWCAEMTHIEAMLGPDGFALVEPFFYVDRLPGESLLEFVRRAPTVEPQP